VKLLLSAAEITEDDTYRSSESSDFLTDIDGGECINRFRGIKAHESPLKLEPLSYRLLPHE
jgi:hypothetical protein